MKIGKLEIKGKLFLAPMCDVTNLPFRLVCKKSGASLTYTEMIHAEAYLMDSIKTKKRTRILREERPVGVQIVGSNILKLKQAAIKIEKEIKPDLVDINFGCPSYNVIKTGSGSDLLMNLPKLKLIVSTLSSCISVPFTCKMRIFSEDSKTIRAAKLIESSGANAITIHGRTAKQGYSGKANWEIIKKIKQELKIPVILNGDVVDEESAIKAFEYTNCDAVMIGRAAMKDPLIFKKINYFLQNKNKLPEQNFDEKLQLIIEIITLCKKYQYLNVSTLKVMINNLTKGYNQGKELRRKLTKIKDVEEIIDLIERVKS